jgi:hypothetical protein
MPSDQDGSLGETLFGISIPRIEPEGSRHRGSPPGCRAPLTAGPLLMLTYMIVGSTGRITEFRRNCAWGLVGWQGVVTRQAPLDQPVHIPPVHAFLHGQPRR